MAGSAARASTSTASGGADGRRARCDGTTHVPILALRAAGFADVALHDASARYSPRMRNPKLVGRIFGLTFGLCGLVALAVGQQMFADDHVLENWPTAEGRITSVEIERRDHSFRDYRGFYTRGKLAMRVVKYSYTASGRERHGEHIEALTEGAANTPIESKYTVGQRVPIHYDGSAPDKAFLELPLRGNGGVVILIVGAVLLLLALLIPLAWNFLWRPTDAAG